MVVVVVVVVVAVVVVGAGGSMQVAVHCAPLPDFFLSDVNITFNPFFFPCFPFMIWLTFLERQYLNLQDGNFRVQFFFLINLLLFTHLQRVSFPAFLLILVWQVHGRAVEPHFLAARAQFVGHLTFHLGGVTIATITISIIDEITYVSPASGLVLYAKDSPSLIVIIVLLLVSFPGQL